MKIKTGKLLIGKRINIILILTILLLFVTIAIPSFCMLLIKDNSNEVEYWDGSIATSYSILLTSFNTFLRWGIFFIIPLIESKTLCPLKNI